jgi:hypothetical protein
MPQTGIRPTSGTVHYDDALLQLTIYNRQTSETPPSK